MRRLAFCLCLLLFTLSFSARAQDDSGQYRLHTPTTEEYLRATPEITAQAVREDIFTEPYDPDKPFNIVWMIRGAIFDKIEPEIFITLDDSVLQASSDSLGLNIFDLVAWRADEDGDYTARLKGTILAELRYFPVDWNTVGDSLQKHFDTGVSVTPVDFDGDGENEFLLDLYYDGFGLFLTAKVDKSLPQGYAIADVPLWPMRGDRPYFTPGGGSYVTDRLEDVNGDGLPEWVVFNYWGGFDSIYDYSILAWRDGGLKQIAAFSGIYGPPDFTFDDAHSDTPFALHVKNSHLDNWGCRWEDITDYDWNTELATYVEHQHSTIYQANFGCAMQEAENAVWKGDYNTAVGAYTTALSRPLPDDTEASVELRQYALARLAIAYAVLRSANSAKKYLQELQSQPPASEMIQNLVESLSQADLSPLPFCAAAYAAFGQYARLGSYEEMPTHIMVGYGDTHAPLVRIGVPDRARAGCDLNLAVEQLMRGYTFTTDKTPEEQLRLLGIPIRASLQLDLDDDGSSEWLVWTDTTAKPVFFMPDIDTYRVSRPDIPPEDQYNHLSVISLPDNAGRVVASKVNLGVTSDYQLANQYKVGICPDTVQQDAGKLELYRLSFGELVSAVAIQFCGDYDLQSLFTKDDMETIVAQTGGGIQTYQWDQHKLTYSLLTDDQSSASTAIPDTSSEPAYCAVQYQSCDCQCLPIITPFGLEMYDIALTEIDSALGESNIASDDQQSLHYYRALTLEALNRPDEALAEYVSIYTAAPDSAWGKLAALHLEKITS